MRRRSFKAQGPYAAERCKQSFPEYRSCNRSGAEKGKGAERAKVLKSAKEPKGKSAEKRKGAEGQECRKAQRSRKGKSAEKRKGAEKAKVPKSAGRPRAS